MYNITFTPEQLNLIIGSLQNVTTAANVLVGYIQQSVIQSTTPCQNPDPASAEVVEVSPEAATPFASEEETVPE